MGFLTKSTYLSGRRCTFSRRYVLDSALQVRLQFGEQLLFAHGDDDVVLLVLCDLFLRAVSGDGEAKARAVGSRISLSQGTDQTTSASMGMRSSMSSSKVP